VVARLTRWLKQEAARVREWRALDAVYSVGEFPLQLWGWDRARRFVVVREESRELIQKADQRFGAHLARLGNEV
jgi:hypothetical protein